MKSSTLLSFVGIAAIMLVIGTALGSVIFPTTKTETTTSLSPVILMQTGTLNEVEFTQQQPCSYGDGWIYPWAVVLNNQTVVEPSNATLGVSEGAIAHNDVNYSAIWFSLPK